MRRNGFSWASDPILKPLNTIECRDAILTSYTTEQEWPKAYTAHGQPAVPVVGGATHSIKVRCHMTEH